MFTNKSTNNQFYPPIGSGANAYEKIAWIYIIMEITTLVAIFISGLLVSFTGYTLYTAFGQPSFSCI